MNPLKARWIGGIAIGGLVVGLGIWALERPGGDELAIPSVGREATFSGAVEEPHEEVIEKPHEPRLDPEGGPVSARRLLDEDKASPQVVRGTVRVAPGRGPAMHLRLLWSGASDRTGFEEIAIDAHGSFEVEPPAGATHMYAAVRLPEGFAPVESVSISAGLPDVSFEVGIGLVRTLRCVDSSSAGLAGVTVFDLGGEEMYLPATGPLDPKIRARKLGTTDSGGNLLLADLPISGTYLGFLADGIERFRRFVTPPEEGESLVVDLHRIPDLVGIAPSPAGHARVRIRANGKAAAYGHGAVTRTWRPGSPSDPSSEIEVLAGARFSLSRETRSLPVLECRPLEGDTILALGAVDPQTGQYTDWRSAEESVLNLDLGTLPPGTATAHLILELQVGVTKVGDQILVERDRSSKLRVSLGRVFLSQPARIEWVEGLRTRAFAQTVLEPGEQALRLLASELACPVRIAVRSRSNAAPLVDAPVEIRTTEGMVRSIHVRTDPQGDVALVGEPGRSYLARVKVEDVAGEAQFKTPQTPGASSPLVELWVKPTTASLRVEVRSTGGADVRIGLARARDLGREQCVVSIAEELGLTNHASFEVAARRARSVDEVIFDGLSKGAYLVYARPLESNVSRFMQLSAAECTAEPLRAKVVLEAGEKGQVRLAPSLPADAHAWIQLELGAGPSDVDLDSVVVEAKLAPSGGGAFLPGSRGVTSGRHTGGGLFEVPIVREGVHQVRVVGVGPVPVTRAMTLTSDLTAKLRRDRTWVLLAGGKWDSVATYELRVTGLGVDSEGRAVPKWYGDEWASIDPPQPGMPLTLAHLDPRVQYTAELRAGEERVVRMLLPVDRGGDATAIRKDTLSVHGKRP